MKILILSLILLCSACAPRGEYKTVDELLLKSKKRYAEQYNTQNVPGLSDLTQKLDQMPSDKSTAGDIAKALDELNQKAGFMTRPAMAELILQYQAIAEGKQSKDFNEASAKLLVSRTYNLLASELESTAFRLS